MRILYCNKYNFVFSGTEVYLFELMELMRAHGHEAALFSMADPRGEPTKYDQHFLPAIDFKGASSGPLSGARQAAHALYSRRARHKLRDMVKAFRPDVAHLRNIYHHLSPSILWELKALGVPVVYHLNDFKLLCPSYNMVAQGHACERCHGGKFWHVVTQGCYSGPPGAALVLAAGACRRRWTGRRRFGVSTGTGCPGRIVLAPTTGGPPWRSLCHPDGWSPIGAGGAHRVRGWACTRLGRRS